MAFTVAILGTGRMGSHLAATWAFAGNDVILSSREVAKAAAVVDALKSGGGYVGTQGEAVPPFALPPGGFRLRAASLQDAARDADVLVLVTPFPVTAGLLESIRASVFGKGKVIIDMTNPWYSGHGLPAAGLQSAALVHQAALGDGSVSWAVAYKNTLWRKILPGHIGEPVQYCGDERAAAVAAALIASHGFVPVSAGGLANSAALEPGRPA